MAKLSMDDIEEATLAGLKDFQRATVERIDYLYRNGQNRVLVADEVGMGKTLIARGVIVKLARLRMEEHDELFKVVYICSNQTIANQNIRKLDITGENAIDSVEDTRLSMQHLKIAQQENSEKVKEGFIQLMPLTPDTSFRITTGGGSVNERALMFAILRRMEEFEDYLPELEDFMRLDATKGWSEWAKQRYEDKVQECEKMSGGDYPANVIRKIRECEEFNDKDDLKDSDDQKDGSGIRTDLIDHLKAHTGERNSKLMNRLRIMFAKISVSMLEPDLVIMDEFQRFKYLLSDDDSETGILAQRFLKGKDTRILLLSATPYKLYSTPEEIEENRDEDHFGEFYQVMNFLFEGKKEEFHTVWQNYSKELLEMKSEQGAVVDMCGVEDVKNKAQEKMYEGVCRTERISVMESGDYTDDKSVHEKEHLHVNEGDIASYLQMAELLKKTDSKYSLPADYVKSCPFLMSFMRKYKLKESLEKYFKEHPEQVGEAKGDLLWLDKKTTNNYGELPNTNARLVELIKRSLGNGEEKYLWVPPSRPYYELQGVYHNENKASEPFSKILVFSSWEMVPRMIGSLVSYEAERRTIGQLAKTADNLEKKNAVYFAKNKKGESGKNVARFPVPRLRFNISGGVAHSMSMFCLLYPSVTLADTYNPIAGMNAHLSLKEIEQEVAGKLHSKLDKIGDEYGENNIFGRVDERWYYLAPMLMDNDTYVKGWIADIKRQMVKETDDLAENGKISSAFLMHIERLEGYLTDKEHIRLGKRPADLVEVLVNMALGSPAVCAYRTNDGDEAKATELARVFINNFNLPESTAIVELAYGKSDDSSHWQKVLKYCKDGCMQSMLDEYWHILSESVGFGSDGDTKQAIHSVMVKSLRMRTSTYAVDTYETFRDRIKGKKGDEIRLRSSFAVGFTKDAGDNDGQINRKESVRNAFNSPMRPFVLATTSIGQEGLDFHNYCRKVMHWNLPSNPVDLEQREGRVNRFKCLAIRQNVAKLYGNITFENDIWKEMFAAAAVGERKENQSELVPFWCFGENQSIKIERIVPMYPISRDEVNYERLVKILSLYRLTLGQARQEELLDYIYREFDDTKELKKLFIDLSPYSRVKRTTVMEQAAMLVNEALDEIDAGANPEEGHSFLASIKRK